MAFTVEPSKFRYATEHASGVAGKRVLISGAGKDKSLGQAFALAAGLNGASHVGVHFHSSYNDGLDLVGYLVDQGVNAFPVQADVTNVGDLWATRSYVMDRMGGKPPNLVICNSGLTEKGYSFGRSLREVEGESRALRRARVRQAFIGNLLESRSVLDTKIDGFLAMTHLWSGEALYANGPLQLVYISSRQAIDPGAAVPGYTIANWAVLQLPRVLDVNLGKSAPLVSAFSVLFPFVRTGMTDEYAANPKVFGRWQPRMLETHEAAECFLQALGRPRDELRGSMFELMVEPADAPAPGNAAPPQGGTGAVTQGVRTTWKSVSFGITETLAPWSAAAPLVFPPSGS